MRTWTTRSELEHMLKHGRCQCQDQWPPVDVTLWPVTDGLRFTRFECINLAVNIIQLIAISSVRVYASTRRRNRLKTFYIESIFARRG